MNDIYSEDSGHLKPILLKSKYFFYLEHSIHLKQYIFVHYCYFFILEKDWKFYGIISFIGIFSIVILSGNVYVCVKCIKLIKLKHRQVRNHRELERNPQAIQLRLLPKSVQNFSSFN